MVFNYCVGMTIYARICYVYAKLNTIYIYIPKSILLCVYTVLLVVKLIIRISEGGLSFGSVKVCN